MTHNSVRLEWTRPTIGVPKKYTILFYCIAQQSSRCNIRGGCTKESFVLQQLRPETSYYFQIHAVCGTGDGTDSEISDVITTNPVCKPGKPTASDISHESIRLAWSKPNHGSD